MCPTDRDADSAESDSGLEALIASWSGERPPAYRIDTRGILRARAAIEAALGAGARAVVLSGPRGEGKTTLIRSFWHDPPEGFWPVFVPPLDASETDQIAEQILAATRRGEVHDAAGALSRMLRAQSLRGARPVLLIDDLDDVAPDALGKLLALGDASRVDVAVVAAGSPGRALDERRRALPRPVRKIDIADRWTRADAERLIARIGATLPIEGADLMAAIDVDEVLRTSAGNPRLVRAALAAQLRQLNLPKIERVMAPPKAAMAVELARSAPVAMEPPPPAIEAQSPEPPLARPRSPARRVAALDELRAARARPLRRRRPSARASRNLAAGIAAAIALVVLVDRAPAVAAWSAATARTYAAAASGWVAARTDEISSAAERKISDAETVVSAKISAAGQTISEAKSSMSERISSAKRTIADTGRDLSAAARGWAEARTPGLPAAPPIRVAVNSDPWSHVEVDGVAAGSTPLMIDLAPGPHKFRAAMADGRTVERELDVAADRNRIVLR